MILGMRHTGCITLTSTCERPLSLVRQLAIFTACLLHGVFKTATAADSIGSPVVPIANPSFELTMLTGFETTALQADGYLEVPALSSLLNGWTITAGVRLYYSGPNNTVAEGRNALLLANDRPGQVSQTMALTPGRTYDISYTSAGAGFGCNGSSLYTVTACNTVGSFTYTMRVVSGEYSMVGFSFVADSKGLLAFRTLITADPYDFCAVVIDAITVRSRPDPVAVPGNLVVNGGFELAPSYPQGNFSEFGDRRYTVLFKLQPLLGWEATVPRAGVWLLLGANTENGFPPIAGSYSLGFQGQENGISQSLSTVSGRRYRLEFNASGYWTNCHETYAITAYLGSTSQTFTVDSTQKSTTPFYFYLDADVFSSLTTLMIFSNTTTATELTINTCNSLLDEISVSDIGPASEALVPAAGNLTGGTEEEVTIEMDKFVDGSELVLRGSPTFTPSKLTLTGNTSAQFGRAMSKAPFRLFERATGRIASFDTKFSFAMWNVDMVNTIGDHGLTFLLAPATDSSGAPGGAMGFGKPGEATRPLTFGVEFDTFQDLEFGDINGCRFDEILENIAHHIGLNVDHVVSLGAVNLYTAGSPQRLNNNQLFYCRVSFDNTTQVVRVWLGQSEILPADPILEATVDLKTLLNPVEWFYVGFSASTEIYLQSHEIHSWQFSSSIPPPGSLLTVAPPPPSGLSGGPILERTGKKSSVSGALIGGIVAALVALIVIAGAITLFCICRKKPNNSGVPPPAHLPTLATPGTLRKDGSGAEALGIPMGPQAFTFEELQAATQFFRIKLGEGGQGGVYLGTLPDGRHVAVKVIDIARNAKGGERAFRAEASTLGSLRHRNLCRFVGWCVENEESKLVCCYEYMPNGSLDMWLYPARQSDNHPPPPPREPLSWPTRFNIALGLSRALTYLHNDAEEKIIHRDVKPGNIMLDQDFNARLGDFGLAFAVAHDATTIESRTNAGTLAYSPPEAKFGMKASEKWDVYAAGLVALELVSGRRAMEFHYSPNEVMLIMYAWQLREEKRPLDLVDKRLGSNFDKAQALKLFEIGLACTVPNPQSRPVMSQVVQALVQEGESILPIQAPTTRPTELAFPDFISNVSSSDTSRTRSSLLDDSNAGTTGVYSVVGSR